jgi:uncharacterized membrane protein
LKNTQKRHIVKSISWRFFGSLDTFLLSFLIIDDVNISLKITLLETISKTIFYYFHERFWFNSSVKNSKTRHFIKPFTWRLVAILDTLLISSVLFNDIKLGFQLSLYEVFTKIILYYIHDKLWYQSKFGLINEK